LNSRLLVLLISFEILYKFSFFCLSFANNCLGCKLTQAVRLAMQNAQCKMQNLNLLVAPDLLTRFDEIVELTLVNSLPFTCTEKPLKFLLTSFSQYTTICFVSLFLYSVFNEHFASALRLQLEMLNVKCEM